ncbi:Hypothetical protein I5071_61660 [Sandaracinus amylolyticus]|nr:Hypothetical protein I5071_61660 [Sandaracinus amylolyticus]
MSIDDLAASLPPRFRSPTLVGAGTHGAVFHAIDDQHALPVAIKCLAAPDLEDLPAFKREFRALVHVSDPHLVQLYELHGEGSQVFFTMEYVEGSTLAESAAHDRRAVFRQIANGLRTLHDAGLTHCDLKPSNVLIARDGRAMLTDYGCVSHYGAPEDGAAGLGSPHYMAPEQWFESSTAPAVDWYALGVMLFEALTGALPFDGDMGTVLLAKRRASPDALRARLRDKGDDALASLCVELLSSDPHARPGADAVLAALDAAPSRARLSSIPIANAPIGREAPLAALRAWLDAPAPGVAALLGPGGIGKSSVLSAFVRELGPRARVLRGRCYPADRSPLRGLDEIASALGEGLRDHEVPELDVQQATALARAFPSLAERHGVEASTAITMTEDASRRALASALTRWIAALAGDRPALVVVDDLQWADETSVEVLELLARGAPPIAVLVGSRSADVAGLVPDLALELQPLDLAESARLAVRLAPELGDRAERIATLAAGNPFLVEALASYALRGGALEATADPLGDVIAAWDPAVSSPSRTDHRDAFAKRLVTVLAIADAPLRSSVAVAASGGRDRDYLPALTRLRARRLLTSRLVRGDDLVELYHRRWAEAVQASLDDDDRRATHRALADAIATHTPGDIGRAADHSRSAGDLELALTRDLDAARLAHERGLPHLEAMRLELAHDSPVADERVRAGVRMRLGDALAQVGRGAEAAKWYRLAAEHARSLEEGVLAERLAAEQLLFSGHHDEGIAVLRRVLDRIDLDLPSSPPEAIARVQSWYSLAANHHLVAPSEGAPITASADDLARIDALHAATLGLSMSDPLATGVAQTFHVDLARAAGEPFRLLRAVTIHLVQTAGTLIDLARTETLTRTARTLTERVGTPEARAILAVAEAGAAWMEARLDDALAASQRARTELASIRGLQWQVDTAVIVQLEALCARGDIAEASALLDAAMRDAESRDDRYLRAHLGVRVAPWVRLWRGRPDQARAEADAGIAAFRVGGFQLLHLMHAVHLARCDLYEGGASAALVRLDDAWATMGRFGMHAIQHYVGVLADVAVVAAEHAAPERVDEWRARCGLIGDASWSRRMIEAPREGALQSLAERGWAEPEHAIRLWRS